MILCVCNLKEIQGEYDVIVSCTGLGKMKWIHKVILFKTSHDKVEVVDKLQEQLMC